MSALKIMERKMGFLEKIFGDLNDKEVKKVEKIADRAAALEEQMKSYSDEQLKAMTGEFRARLAEGETLEDILPEAFAVCREAADRTLGMRHFYVQLVGGVVLHQGKIAEMKTGEGKTLVATLAAYLNALEGKGVHIVTVNDYLAKRDMEWMGRLYNYLGLSVGCVVSGMSLEERRAAYACDITYATNNELGFDFLRDNMVIYADQRLQRGSNYAIVDEVDSVLVDEARTPLAVSGEGNKSTEMYQVANSFIKKLKRDEDYTVDEKDRSISFTDEGIATIEKAFNIENLSDPENMAINHHILIALKARDLMKRDIDYIVKDGEVVIVDELSGRLMLGRRYGDGLHQAIEAKEGLRIKRESQTLGSITIQNLFRGYSKLAGMTGTAKTEEDEFREIYNLDVVCIPTNKPTIRKDEPDSVYVTEKGKYSAIIKSIEEKHATGQPLLVGTISIQNSEKISEMLKKKGIKHNVLNAKHHEQEAAIIAEAGRLGAVTISTNMAGRGTDIILGGNPEFLAKLEMKKKGYDEETISYASSMIYLTDSRLIAAREEYKALYDKYKAERQEEHDKVVAAGGLHIIGSERYESRRVDNQLRGRSGRQGDPGSSQYFVSLEDPLIRIFGGEKIQQMVQKMGLGEDEAIEAKVLTKTIENAQKKVEGRNFSIRKFILQYDNVMNKQREVVYRERKRVLEGENLRDHLFSMLDEIVSEYVEMMTVVSKYQEEWDLEELQKNINKICANAPLLSFDNILEMEEEDVKDSIMAAFEEIYKKKEEEIGIERIREVERMILLKVVDTKWIDHIDAMDQLRQGIGLRAIGHENPTAAYAKEGFEMFELMIKSIKDDMVKYCFNATIETSTSRSEVVSAGARNIKTEYVDNEVNKAHGVEAPLNMPQKQQTVVRTAPKVGRNDPCPCGSGKKYKNCCGKEV